MVLACPVERRELLAGLLQRLRRRRPARARPALLPGAGARAAWRPDRAVRACAPGSRRRKAAGRSPACRQRHRRPVLGGDQRFGNLVDPLVEDVIDRRYSGTIWIDRSKRKADARGGARQIDAPAAAAIVHDQPGFGRAEHFAQCLPAWFRPGADSSDCSISATCWAIRRSFCSAVVQGADQQAVVLEQIVAVGQPDQAALANPMMSPPISMMSSSSWRMRWPAWNCARLCWSMLRTRSPCGGSQRLSTVL